MICIDIYIHFTGSIFFKSNIEGLFKIFSHVSSLQSQPGPPQNHNTQHHATNACKLTQEPLHISPVRPAEQFELHYSCSVKRFRTYQMCLRRQFLAAWQPRQTPVAKTLSDMMKTQPRRDEVPPPVADEKKKKSN